MNDRARQGDSLRKIDEVCDAFEKAIAITLSGDAVPPSLQEYVARVDEADQELAVEMLLALDQHYGGKDKQQTDYLEELTPEHHAAVMKFFSSAESPMTESFHSGEASAATLPSQIGPYKVLRRIGFGGMGEVYLAEQTSPVRRQVALKVIKAGLDTKDVVARFEAERQALAMMDHQNIAKVLDLGVTDDGQLYFAMEYVQGIPITEYCDKYKLSLNDRLVLFGQVCRAIQHSHQKGVIHRDLKPSNVLVTRYDDVPVVKVIDFGLAKALQWQTRLTDKTLVTRIHQVLGTWEYMSPEQAKPDELGVDTRTDVYSLGVLLYELLTGSTPLESQRINELADYLKVKLICEDEAPRPSARLSDSGDAITEISEQRQIDPRQLSLKLKGELDWIAVKALEKDRVRRYDGAGALADDIQRYLEGEPIAAHPPSMGYRLQKTIRKHKAAFVTGTAIVVLLVAGLVGTGTMWMRAEDETARANKQTVLAVAAQKAEEKQRKLATEEAHRARESEAKAKAAELKANEKTAEADEAKLQAQQSTKKAERQAYISDIRLVHSEWKANQFEHAGQLLQRHRDTVQKGFEWYYMSRLFRRELFSMTGRESSVLQSQPQGMVFSPSGNRVAISFFTRLRDSNTAIGTNVPLSPLKVITRGLSQTPSSVSVYDVASGKEIGHIETKHTDRVIAFKPDETQVVLRDDAQTVTVWDVTTGKTVPTTHNLLPSDERLHLSLPFPWQFVRDETRIAAFINILDTNSGRRGMVKLLDATSGDELHTLTELDDWVQSVTFSPDGKRIYVVSVDGEVKVWDTGTSVELPNLIVSNGRIVSHGVWFSRDGLQIAAEVEFRPSDTLENGNRPFNIDTDIDWIGRDDHDYQGQVWLWDVLNGKRTVTLAGHSGRVNDLTFSPNGMSIATASDDKTVKLWSSARGDELLTLKGHAGKVNSVSFSPDGTRIASTSSDGTGKVWDIAGTTAGLMLGGRGTLFSDFSFSRDGIQLVTVDLYQVRGTLVGDGDGGVAVWDVLSGRLTSKLEKHAFSAVPRVWLSPDGSRVAAGVIQFVENPRIVEWDVNSTKVIRSHVLKDLPKYEYTGESTVFSPDGRLFAAGLNFNMDSGFALAPRLSSLVQIWETGTGKAIHTLFAHKGRITSVVFRQDGMQIAVSGYDEILQSLTLGPYEEVYSVKVWDVDTGTFVHQLKGQRATINATTFNHDGTRLATANNDGTVKLWEITANEFFIDRVLHTLKGHIGSVTSVAFSPDGTRVASCDDKGSVKIWDTMTGEELITFDPEKNSSVWGSFQRVIFSPTGRFLAATGDDNSSIRLWDARPFDH